MSVANNAIFIVDWGDLLNPNLCTQVLVGNWVPAHTIEKHSSIPFPDNYPHASKINYNHQNGRTQQENTAAFQQELGRLIIAAFSQPHPRYITTWACKEGCVAITILRVYNTGTIAFSNSPFGALHFWQHDITIIVDCQTGQVVTVYPSGRGLGSSSSGHPASIHWGECKYTFLPCDRFEPSTVRITTHKHFFSNLNWFFGFFQTLEDRNLSSVVKDTEPLWGDLKVMDDMKKGAEVREFMKSE